MKSPYSYTPAKAEGLRLQILSEEEGLMFNPACIDTLRQAADMGDVDAAMSMADFYRSIKDDSGYLHWLKIADEGGNIDASCILFDWVRKADVNWAAMNWAAIKYYARRIIEAPYIESPFYQNHLALAQLFLLVAHFRCDGEDKKQFIDRVLRLANGGDNLAQELMARFHRSGSVEKSSLDDAKKWYLKAAENGNARAQNEYANLLLEHWSDKSVFADAFEWRKKAAESGYGLAQFNLAGMYFEGIGTRADRCAAVHWLEAAAKQGNACAMLNLSELFVSGGEIPIDYEKSRDMLKQAADRGEGNANLVLALRLLIKGNDERTLQECGYRLIVGHKICGVETESDWRLTANQNRIASILKHNLSLKERMEKALAFYTRYPHKLTQKILEMFDARAAKYKRKVDDDADGIVVNLHYIGPCNFNCRTCYFPRDTFMLKLDSWKIIVDQIVASVKVKRFNLAGGEPLIAKDEFVQGLIDHVKSYDIDVSIITNGYCLTPELIDRNKGKIDMIGISVDGTTDDINRRIGRATQDGKVLTKERLYELVDHIHAAGMRLKINTQVMKPTCSEDFHELIRRVRPDKWKLLRTSIREDVNSEAKGFVTSEHEFQNFVTRHKDLNPIVEDEGDIKNAYYMVFQYGEFVCVEGDSHRHLMPLVFGDVKESLNQIPHNSEGYRKRYSDEK